MDLDKYDELLRALARGERVSRHDYDVFASTIAELEDMGIIDRDDEGYHIAGPMFDHFRGEF